MNNNETTTVDRIRKENSKATSIVDTYREINGTYRAVLEAMGASRRSPEVMVQNSANIVVAFRNDGTR